MIFGNIHLFPIFMELTLHRQKTPFSYFNVWKEEDLWAKEASKRRPEGQTRGAHAATVPGRVGPTRLGLVAPLPSISSPPTSS